MPAEVFLVNNLWVHFTFSYCLALFSRVLWFQRLTAVPPKTRITETRFSRLRPTIRSYLTNVNTGTYCPVSRRGGAARTASGPALRRYVKVNSKQNKNEKKKIQY